MAPLYTMRPDKHLHFDRFDVSLLSAVGKQSRWRLQHLVQGQFDMT